MPRHWYKLRNGFLGILLRRLCPARLLPKTRRIYGRLLSRKPSCPRPGRLSTFSTAVSPGRGLEIRGVEIEDGPRELLSRRLPDPTHPWASVRRAAALPAL